MKPTLKALTQSTFRLPIYLGRVAAAPFARRLAPDRIIASVFATTPCLGLSLCA
jgi:hypothetical protein